MASRWNKQKVLTIYQNRGLDKADVQCKSIPFQSKGLRNVDLAQIRLKEAGLRIHQNKNIPQNIIEAFDAISSDTTTSSTPNATLTQYKNHFKKFNIAYLKSISAEIFNILLNPLLIVDKAVEESIMLLVNATFMAECANADKSEAEIAAVNGPLDISAVSTKDLLWSKGDPALEDAEIIMPIMESEGFITLSDEDLNIFIKTNSATLNSFKESNPWIKTETEDWTPAVAEYFSNSYQDFVDSHAKYTTIDYINFVDDVNKSLSDKEVIKDIKTLRKPIVKSTPAPKNAVGKKKNKRTMRVKGGEPTVASAPQQPKSLPKTKEFCEKARELAIEELKKDMKNIKMFVYEMAMLPMLMLVVYNLYFMFFGREDNLYSNDTMYQLGCKAYRFPDWEKIFREYENYYTSILTEFIFKPSQLMSAFLNTVQHIGVLHDINNKYPYLMYFAVFAIVLFNWTHITNDISAVMKGFMLGNSIKHTFLYKFSSVSSWIYFVIHIIVSFSLFALPFATPPDKLHFSPGNLIITVINLALKIAIWVIKGMVVSSTIELSAFILAIYLIYVSIFSIYINKKTVNHGLNDIFQTIYTKFFTPFDGGGLINEFLNIMLIIGLQIFNYTFEIFMSVIVISNAYRCVSGLQSNELKSILILLTLMILIGIGGWTAYKTFRILPEIDRHYEKTVLGGDKTVLQVPTSLRVLDSKNCEERGGFNDAIEEIQNTEKSLIERFLEGLKYYIRSMFKSSGYKKFYDEYREEIKEGIKEGVKIVQAVQEAVPNMVNIAQQAPAAVPQAPPIPQAIQQAPAAVPQAPPIPQAVPPIPQAIPAGIPQIPNITQNIQKNATAALSKFKMPSLTNLIPKK